MIHETNSETSPRGSGIQIRICDDDKIKKELSNAFIQQQLINHARVSHSLPTELVEPRGVLAAKRIKQRNANGTHMEEKQQTGGGNNNKHLSYTPEYNNSYSIDRLLSPRIDISGSYRTIKDTPMEKQLDDVRKRFERRRHVESQLGLTPYAGSRMVSPTQEAVDIEEQVLERREELGFRRRTFWKSCCGVIDRRATQFFVQVMIGAGVMIFCMAKIWQAVPLHGCTGEDTTVYFSLLSALVGFYIPSPSMNKQ